MQVLQEVHGLETDALWTVAAGFGGGLGRCQSVCGALSGGTMVLGLLESRGEADLKKVGGAVRPKVRRLLDDFADRFGHIECRDLVAPCDFNAPDGHEAFAKSGFKQERCSQYVTYVVETLAGEA